MVVTLPDYSLQILRAYTIKKYQLGTDEKFKIFMLTGDTESSDFPWVIPPMEPGETRYLIDVETGLEMPFTIPVGYDFEVIKIWGSSSEPYIGREYVDGNLDSNLHVVPFDVYFEQEIGLTKISDFDPTLSTEHTYAISITHLGDEPALGTALIEAVLRKVHTEKITTKVVRCKYCGHQEEVPLETTRYKCPKCGMTTLFMYYPWGGRK